MSVTDLIADQLTVMRNAIMAGHKTVIIKRSGIIEGIIRIAKEERFIENYQVLEDNKQGKIKIYLKYTDDGTPVLGALQRVSTPGLREHVPAKSVKRVMGGVGIAIISTSKGLMTDQNARASGIGGELICRFW